MKFLMDEKKNLIKKIDVMMKTAKMREKQLAVNIESRIKEQQKRMIEEFFTIMKAEIQTTCDQARAIRKENVQRDATEKKLVSIILAQESFIEELRDRAMNWDVQGVRTMMNGIPYPVSSGGGGLHSHGLSLVRSSQQSGQAKHGAHHAASTNAHHSVGASHGQ